MRLLSSKVEDEHIHESSLKPDPCPDTLPMKDIFTDPKNFQMRATEIVERHVGGLEKLVRAGTKLDPIVVWSTKAGPIVLDGHHRLEAYHRAGCKSGIPVKYFEGTFGEAMRVAVKGNSKDKLPLTFNEKANAAWRLVVNTKSSVRAISTTSGVSKSVVGRMNVVKKLLITGDLKPADYSQWWQALDASKGEDSKEFTEFDEEAMVEEWCEKLGKAFGNKAQQQHSILAMALERYMGHQFDEFVRYLKTPLNDFGFDDEF